MNPLYSPFIVPLGAFAMALGIVLIISIRKYNQRKLQSDERMAAIARGIPLPPEPVDTSMNGWGGPGPADPKVSMARTRRGGIIMVAVGLGIIVGLVAIAWTQHEQDALAGCIGGIIPLFIGLGLLLDYTLQKRDQEREDTRASQQRRG